jgi:hypothetical protein
MFQLCAMLSPLACLSPRGAIADRWHYILLLLLARRIGGFSINFLRFLRFLLKGGAARPFIFASIISTSLMAPPRRTQPKINVGLPEQGRGSGFSLSKVTEGDRNSALQVNFVTLARSTRDLTAPLCIP